MTSYAFICDTATPPQLAVTSEGVVSMVCNGQASYRDISSLPNSSWFLPAITETEAYELAQSILIVMVIAFGIRAIRRVF